MQVTLKMENMARPIAEGEAGIVLTAEGGFYIFNTHKDLDPENFTPLQAKQAKTLRALSIAVQIPQIMHLLETMSVDPNIVGDGMVERGVAQ